MQRFHILLSAFALILCIAPQTGSAQIPPNGQNCPTPLRDQNIGQGIPNNSHIIGFAEGRGRLPDASAKASRNAPPRTFRVFVIEKDGQCYKVANSDLGRTMYIKSEDLSLQQNTHYELRMRKLPDPAAEGEAPEEKDCSAKWEVLSGGLR